MWFRKKEGRNDMARNNSSKHFDIIKRRLNEAFGVNGWRFTKLRLFIEYRKDGKWVYFAPFDQGHVSDLESRLAQIIQNNTK